LKAGLCVRRARLAIVAPDQRHSRRSQADFPLIGLSEFGQPPLYPGASAQTVSDTVATPIEQEVNGVENMLYLYSQATSDGGLSLTVTFKPGTDLDKAQVLVQNRVALAVPRLPQPVQRNGVSVKNFPLALRWSAPRRSRGRPDGSR
jgi:AcrB/AcrD/AcrF family protein